MNNSNVLTVALLFTSHFEGKCSLMLPLNVYSSSLSFQEVFLKNLFLDVIVGSRSYWMHTWEKSCQQVLKAFIQWWARWSSHIFLQPQTHNNPAYLLYVYRLLYYFSSLKLYTNTSPCTHNNHNFSDFGMAVPLPWCKHMLLDFSMRTDILFQNVNQMSRSASHDDIIWPWKGVLVRNQCHNCSTQHYLHFLCILQQGQVFLFFVFDANFMHFFY